MVVGAPLVVPMNAEERAAAVAALARLLVDLAADANTPMNPGGPPPRADPGEDWLSDRAAS